MVNDLDGIGGTSNYHGCRKLLRHARPGPKSKSNFKSLEVFPKSYRMLKLYLKMKSSNTMNRYRRASPSCAPASASASNLSAYYLSANNPQNASHHGKGHGRRKNSGASQSEFLGQSLLPNFAALQLDLRLGSVARSRYNLVFKPGKLYKNYKKLLMKTLKFVFGKSYGMRRGKRILKF